MEWKNDTDSSEESEEDSIPMTAASVPISHALKKLLESPGVFSQVKQYLEELQNDSSSFQNIIQGQLWRRKLQPESDRLYLPLILHCEDWEFQAYAEEFDIERKQSLSAIHVALPFLPPRFQALNAFVTLTMHSKARKSSDNRLVFRSIIKELNDLYSYGIKLNIPKQSWTCVYLKCVMVTAENSVLNSICGFKDSSFCRICSASPKECATMLKENAQMLRTKKSYNEAACKLESGIKEQCVFNQLADYHVVENHSFDLSKDFLLGVVSHTLSRILTHLIFKNKLLSLKEFNKIVVNFNYKGNFMNKPERKDDEVDPDLVTKPQPFKSKSGNLQEGELLANRIVYKQTAVQSLQLCNYLGLMIGHLVPKGDECWEIYIALKKVTAIITAPRIFESQIAELEYFIYELNNLYLKHFGALKPVHHLLLHVPRILRDNGPLVHFQSAIIQKMNFKFFNVSGEANSLPELIEKLPGITNQKIQFKQCYQFCKDHTVEGELGKVKNEVDSDVKKFDWGILDYKSYNSVEICGVKYTPDAIIMRGFDGDEQRRPRFSEIATIYNTNNDVRFIVKDIPCEAFDEHLQAYRVGFPSETEISSVKAKDILLCYGTFIAATIKNSTYISANYGYC